MIERRTGRGIRVTSVGGSPSTPSCRRPWRRIRRSTRRPFGLTWIGPSSRSVASTGSRYSVRSPRSSSTCASARRRCARRKATRLQSSLSALLLSGIDEIPGDPLDDVREVSSYVAALEHGLQRMHDGFPLSNRLIREIHGHLLIRGRGADKEPGEFRRTQNWIGGSLPGNAASVLPPPHDAEACMSALKKLLHGDPTVTPILIKAGLAHVELETIHPFLDGNGRGGRLLVPLILCADGLLREPLLYLSLFKQRREEYYDRLQRVRVSADWEGWLAFFLDGIAQASSVARSRALWTSSSRRGARLA